MNRREIIWVVIVGILLVAGIIWLFGERDDLTEECVPSSCCHAEECVWGNDAPDCEGVFCSMSCEPESMDCGQGQCEVINGECGVVWDE